MPLDKLNILAKKTKNLMAKIIELKVIGLPGSISNGMRDDVAGFRSSFAIVFIQSKIDSIVRGFSSLMNELIQRTDHVSLNVVCSLYSKYNIHLFY